MELRMTGENIDLYDAEGGRENETKKYEKGVIDKETE